MARIEMPQLAQQFFDGKCVNHEFSAEGLGTLLVDVLYRFRNQLFRRISMPHAIQLINTLEPEERLELFEQFCSTCGSEDPRCQCTSK